MVDFLVELKMSSIPIEAYNAIVNKGKIPEVTEPPPPILAIWPEPLYIRDKWWMRVCRLMPDMSLKWSKSHPPELFDSLEVALKVARQRNKQLLETIANLSFSLVQQQSITMKVTKELQKKERLIHEEGLMLQEAKERAYKMKRAEINDLILPDKSEKFRQILHKQLTSMPYLTRVVVTDKKKKFILERSKKDKFEWSKPILAKAKTLEFTYKATIAEGFDLDPEAPWGKTKATIRDLLLPSANKLLQLASVQRLLSEAKLKGQYVLVCNRYVFWYEENGNIGWTVKQTDSSLNGKRGNTLWLEGEIESKNHGRLIILPYIKSNGELVKGHTKNGPNDGPAKPRHPSQYVSLPFHILKDDLMVGLLGDLPYE